MRILSKKTNTEIINKKYNKERPLLTIRTDLPKEILKFIKELKAINEGSKWVNEAIKEKYSKEENENFFN
ncbi:MAG: hypothetical protein PVJ67_06570 [Candidatus Pacearchaeota archaeon]|jgi:hypothetical protein